MEALEAHVATLLAAFDGKADVAPSFGSMRATLAEASIANSSGARTSFAHTTVELEIAVKASGGPEGPPPGEYWVNDTFRRLDPGRVPGDVEAWCGFARDVRRARPTPSGARPVVLPPSVVAGILPSVLGYRFTGGARLREVAPAEGTVVGVPELSVRDDGRVPWAIASAAVDDEGTPQRSRTLVSNGAVSGLLYDLLHGAAFEVPSTGNGLRGAEWYRDWRRFLHAPVGTSTTIVIEPGTSGTDPEVVEAAGDGIWVQQLGWAVPDPLSTAFGGEVRIGYRIRNGKLAEPVRGGTVGGVVLAPPGSPSMLSPLGALGSDAVLEEGVLSPTSLVKGLTVAGPGA
jgi:predicted Zn-dependent protease